MEDMGVKINLGDEWMLNQLTYIYFTSTSRAFAGSNFVQQPTSRQSHFKPEGL